MIKVNLLKNRAVVSPAVPAAAGVKASGGIASSIEKASLSKFSFSKKPSSSLDGDFDTFECSPVAQFLKLVLLVGFIVPLVGYEKMRSSSGQAVISSKTRELQSYQAIKIDKQKALAALKGLDKKKEELISRGQELFEIKKHRLTALYGIDELQTAVPSDVWLTSVNFVDNGRLDVTGQTLLDSGLDRLVVALKASPKIDRINVQKDITIRSATGRSLNEFKVTMVIVPETKTKNLEDVDGR